MKQSTDHIFMVRPANFGFNEETAVSNAFQNQTELTSEDIKKQVLTEFDAYVNKLREKGVNVTVIEDTKNPVKPDAIFPNNWGSFHEDGTVILYPMATPNRRIEKREDIIADFKTKYNISKVIDLSKYENENRFCEGTGSIIFDHINKRAYACLSPRTDKNVFVEVCSILNYKPIYFTSTDIDNQEIYHTNVMMCISEKFAVVCLDSIRNEDEKQRVVNSLEETGHEIVEITLNQVYQFAGNMLTVCNNSGKEYLVMSNSAFNILTEEQKDALMYYNELLPVDVGLIEKIGGGSARCMISEIFLTENNLSE